MLARANRLVRADDYRRLVRRGRRFTSLHTVVYVAARSDAAIRFGFIVPKTVGIAVDRNLVRRRLKAISHDALPGLTAGLDVVIRALPGAAQVGWDTLRSEVSFIVESKLVGFELGKPRPESTSLPEKKSLPMDLPERGSVRQA